MAGIKLAPNVRYIPPIETVQQGKQRSHALRVAAYCRVSTDDEDQLNSYKAQVDYYTQKISQSEEWVMAGIFPDEGITGTNLKKREQFKRMMNMCRRGKIDMILCKSVSRFARNTVDCLNAVRELKTLKIPVIFEKENINTMQQQSEFIITLYGSFAQAESESISANVRWGKRKSMQDGKVAFQYNKLLGYRKGADGKPEIVPEEAEIVRRIYNSYLAGRSLGSIQEELEGEGIPAASGIKGWSKQVIQNILKNERYIGDALLQKTYRVDCLTKTTKKNNGELPQYYVENNHPAIVPRSLYHRVQEEIARRAGKRKIAQKTAKTERGKYSSKYALTERLVCGKCGTPYRRCTWSRNGVKRIVWRCVNRLEFGKRYCEDSPTIDEYKLHTAILKTLNRVVADKETIISAMRAGLDAAINGEAESSPQNIKDKMKILDAELMELVDKITEAEGNTAEMDNKLRAIAREKAALKQKKEAKVRQVNVLHNANTRIDEMMELIKKMVKLDAYDDMLTARVVERIIVVDAETVRVTLVGGIELEEKLE